MGGSGLTSGGLTIIAGCVPLAKRPGRLSCQPRPTIQADECRVVIMGIMMSGKPDGFIGCFSLEVPANRKGSFTDWNSARTFARRTAYAVYDVALV